MFCPANSLDDLLPCVHGQDRYISVFVFLCVFDSLALFRLRLSLIPG